MFQTCSELKSVFSRLFSNIFGIDLEMAVLGQKNMHARSSLFCDLRVETATITTRVPDVIPFPLPFVEWNQWTMLFMAGQHIRKENGMLYTSGRKNHFRSISWKTGRFGEFEDGNLNCSEEKRAKYEPYSALGCRIINWCVARLMAV